MWFGHVGSDSQIVASDRVRFSSSATSRSAPEPPGACAARMRVMSAPGPKASLAIDRVEAGIAGKAEIGLGVLALQQPLFGLAHGAHDRRLAVAILVDADAEVDLVGARVGAIEADQGKDLVGGSWLEIFEHGRRFRWRGGVIRKSAALRQRFPARKGGAKRTGRIQGD